MRFADIIGFVRTNDEFPGLWTPVFVERRYRGEVLSNIRKFEDNEKVNNDVIVTNRISIIADNYIIENSPYIRYVHWGNNNWRVTNIEINHPRIILTLGGIYNGAEGAGTSSFIEGSIGSE